MGLDLLAVTLTDDRLSAVTQLLDTFWAGTEPLLDRWAAANARLADQLQWGRRRRRHEVLIDNSLAPPVFVAPTTADVLGWLYVREGSTLGGAVIEAHARTLLGRTRLPSFAPYDEGPQPMWRGYLRVLEDWAASNDARLARVADAAATTFEALESWLLPVFVTTLRASN